MNYIKENIINDKEIEVVLENVLEDFKLPMDYIDRQKREILKFLYSHCLTESAILLEKSVEELKNELLREVKDLFPVKSVSSIKSIQSDIVIPQIIGREEFIKQVALAYDSYVKKSQGLLIDVVSDLKNYEMFNPGDYLDCKSKNVMIKRRDN